MTPLSPDVWEPLRVASLALAPAEVVEVRCPACQAFQCHRTRSALLAGGVCLRRPTRVRCRSCGRDWKYNPGDPANLEAFQ